MVAFRSGGTAVDVWAYASPLPVVATPTKLFDGSVPFLNVSNVTAMPEIPAAPSAPPLPPTIVGRAPDAGLPSTNAMPSAPLPWSMRRSNDAVRLAVGTAVGQNVDPEAAP